MEEMHVTTPNPQSAIRNPQFLVRNPVLPATWRQQRNTILSLVMAFVVVLLLVQLWLLVEAVEGDRSGGDSITVPATLISGLCFLGAGWLWRMLR